ncbi:lytic polysaccharide monooxygenase [Streptosporangium carneum]|uniref:Cellulose-binding protein n=1 Tax=Streptosporangium carneum TaxID=47481 RepID=A0A9W6IA42_9ACTN|nr:lytic polysaccharide monooxygenase [Streptosporangium carneum]GLK14867.1 cellulose-binding protein [Streptosporangium carneum]
MRRTTTLLSASMLAMVTTVFMATPAEAHGYISNPPSRQAFCAQGKIACGEVKYEPQSVEAPKGGRTCSGGSRFTELDDDSRNWPVTSVGNTVNFTWSLTARHATSTWEYYIGGTKIASFNDGGRQPGATVNHSVSMGGRTGRQKVLAIWNIADTGNAFYACVDLQVGGGGNPSPTPTVTPTVTPTSTPTVTPTSTPTNNPGGTWSAGTAYRAGDQVTYGSASYRCLQAHTALTGWEPPNVPSLWQKL